MTRQPLRSRAHGRWISLPVVLVAVLHAGGASPAAPTTPTKGAPPDHQVQEWAGGPDTRVNDPATDADAPPSCRTQNGPSLARSGDTVVASFVDASQCDLLLRRTVEPTTAGISLSGYAWSEDAGASWHDGGTLRPPAGGNLFGDGVVAAGPGGAFHYATLIGDPGCCRVGVSTSPNGGRSWTAVREVGTDRPARFHDKPWIAVDGTGSPWTGRLYVVWTEFDPAGNGVYLAWSDDDGATFSPSVHLSVSTWLVSRYGEYPGVGAQVAIGPGGRVHVVWADGARLWHTSSVDGGQSFVPPSRISQLLRPGHPAVCVPGPDADLRTWVISGDIRVFQWPSMAIDMSGSPDPGDANHNPWHGSVYVASTARPTGFDFIRQRTDDADVVLLRSRDGGATWHDLDAIDYPAEPLNDDGTGTDQFHPQVAVDATGAVAVTWYDRRGSALPDGSGAPSGPIELYATVSTDGGTTFGPGFPVSDVAFPVAPVNPHPNWLAGCYMGDYNGLVDAPGGGFIAAWGDNRDGPVGLPDANVYSAAIR